ncbi:uncharacterized protein [Venturia canescens]|uniref:uncharacterized protein isoform X1 n=1 Tax=Venturia canescens TaxID=32260 RepID=UPI001C9C7667|nr:uncharacterized protein LOC122416124 isoform X1 [Venturia canescens]
MRIKTGAVFDEITTLHSAIQLSITTRLQKMSTLFTVLGAAAIFILILRTNGATVQKKDTICQLDQSIGTIDALVTSVRKNALNVSSRQASEKNLAVVQEFQKNATEFSRELRSALENVANENRLGLSFNETTCSRYFNDFEKSSKVLMKELDDSVSVGSAEMAASLRNMLGPVANETKTKIMSFKDKAATCKGFACKDISLEVNKVLNAYVVALIRLIYDNDAEFNNESADKIYQRITATGNEAFNRSRDCLSSL